MALTTKPTKKQQVIDAVIDNIRLGELAPGKRLATVRDMSEHFQVSVSVIQGALRELVTDGFVECRGAGGFYIRGDSDNGTGQAELPAQSSQKAMGEKLFLTCVHHSDLVWNQTYDQYAAIREEQINKLLDYAAKYPDFHFHFDQAEVVRVYLKQHPEKLEQIRHLAKDGRLELLGGLAIPDLNLCSGESLLRNLIMGRQWYRQNLDVEPTIAGMMDAFGMCAQLPQILHLASFKYLVPGRLPNLSNSIDRNRPFNWKGLDGTNIVVVNCTACISHQGYVTNVPVIYPPAVRLGQTVANLKQLQGDVLVFYCTELGLLEEDIFWIIEVANRQGGRPITFGRVSDFMSRIDSAALPVHSGEINPTFTGCYTTRIGVKQNVRRLENLVFVAEALDALTTADADFVPVWRELILTQFHDAICGCHTDAANADIAKKFSQVENACQSIVEDALAALAGDGCTIFNPTLSDGRQIVEMPFNSHLVPTGVPTQLDGDSLFFEAELLPFGLTAVKTAKAKPENNSRLLQGKTGIETEYFQADFTGGRARIKAKCTPKNVFGDNFGEILFRWDNGSMWSEQLMCEPHGSQFQDEKLLAIQDGDLFYKVVTEGKVRPGVPPVSGNFGDYWTGFGSLSFTREFFFPKKLDYFKLKLRLAWQGNNTKISISFPVQLDVANAAATYAVPFGSIVRKPYFEVPCEYAHTATSLNREDYPYASGDWPTLDWVNYSDHNSGLSVANTGTPGHQLVGNNIFVSLIRSATRCTDGSMYPQPGSFDNGVHEFEFAFRAHHPSELGKAVQLGELLNRKPLLKLNRGTGRNAANQSFLACDHDNIVLSAFYAANGCLVARFYESLGKTTKAKFNSPFHFFETDLNLTKEKLCSDHVVQFKPFEIKTLKLKK